LSLPADHDDPLFTDYDDDDFDETDGTAMDVADSTAEDSLNVFSPSAASGSRDGDGRGDTGGGGVRHRSNAAELLGRLGAAERGLYIVLLADDVHSTQQLLEALREFLGFSNFYTDTLLQKVARALKLFGQLVLFGVQELVTECGLTQVQLWRDGDALACQRIGSVVLERSRRLSRRGLFCSICTGNELRVEQRAVHALQWLSAVARSCDPLCQTVAECILPRRHLVPLLRADFKMSARVTKAWYSLLLTLLAVPQFKSHLAAAYCDTYRNVTAKYARGLGVLERTGYTLSVQFLNRVTYVVDLVQGRDLLGKLGKAILETLQVAVASPLSASSAKSSLVLNPRLNPDHAVLAHRRYSPCISDLKCVLNVHGMPRVVACEGATFLHDWSSALAMAQWVDPHVWRHWALGHVETESRGWVGAFNASISLGSLFERLLGWSDDDPSPITEPTSPYSRGLLTCVEMTFRVLMEVQRWQAGENPAYAPTLHTVDPHRRTPCSLPMATVAAQRGTALAMRHLGVSQATPFSFHLPLHRFVASCLRELCIRRNDEEAGVAALARVLKERLTDRDVESLFSGLMEFPTLVLSRSAQVRAGLWRRNGPGLNDQVLNYSEPPFCRTMRDADLLMVQFAVLAGICPGAIAGSDVSITYFFHLLLHRMGLFDFCGLAKAPSWNINAYLRECEKGLFPRELQPATDESEDDIVLPWAYCPAREASSCVFLLEELLHLLIVFTTELPLPSPESRLVHTQQAQWKLQREVVHRLASGQKTHSELSEVQHVLSHWDNTLLCEEGKLINPDDATTASLGTCLKKIAVRKASGRLEPDKWEMNAEAWGSYDPAFFHVSLRNHQTAAENRPKAEERSGSSFGWEPRPYAPKPHEAHSYFQRLRRDVTADATVLSVAYRVLHVHCRQSEKNLADVLGKSAYEERSETALARACHLLTLGAYAWMDASGASNWREHGGGSVGSIFFDRTDPPTVADWITHALLSPPQALLESDWYAGEEPTLLLLRRLAVNGGGIGGFRAQDSSVRAGAAWLCDFCVKNCSSAASLLGGGSHGLSSSMRENDLERRKREAREKALAKMKAQAAKFALSMDVNADSDADDEPQEQIHASPHPHPLRANSLGSARSSASSAVSSSFSDNSVASAPLLPVEGIEVIPRRLLRSRPRCIICNDEESDDVRQENDDVEGKRKRTRRKTDNDLGFVGYAQPSTVLKGGGGPPSVESSTFRDHTGCFVQICSHAVHLSCCESYLASVSHRDERIGKRDEFRCPLCQRLSNCLVPFIDVGVDWIESPVKASSMLIEGVAQPSQSINDFLTESVWWVTRHIDSVVWDGHSAYTDVVEDPVEAAEGASNGRRSYRRLLRKKDLYAAWNAMMKTPRFVRKRIRPRNRHGTSSDPRLPDASSSTEAEESTGETLVWRRFMDLICDISYRADSKRLGDDRLHEYFGEFRHYVAEKFAYNVENQFLSGIQPVDVSTHLATVWLVRTFFLTLSSSLQWPSCMYTETLPEAKRQEMSREKLLSKLLLTIQCFTYSVASESFEARRNYKKAFPMSSDSATFVDSSSDSVLSRFGMSGVACDGMLVVLPEPSPDEDDGAQPFDGRLGKLRYFALAVMAAAGAVASDLVQLVIQFPAQKSQGSDDERPLRSPVAQPILFGHVLTHTVAAMCGACGRGRARSDALEVFWPESSILNRGSQVLNDEMKAVSTETVTHDCEGFMKLGLLARILQVLLAELKAPAAGFDHPHAVLTQVKGFCRELQEQGVMELPWINSCAKILESAVSTQMDICDNESSSYLLPTAAAFREACTRASHAAADFLVNAGAVLQILIPGVMYKYEISTLTAPDQIAPESTPGMQNSFEQARLHFKMEPIDEMIESSLVREVLSSWYENGREHYRRYEGSPNEASRSLALRRRLYRTLKFHNRDWPSVSNVPDRTSSLPHAKPTSDRPGEGQPKPEIPPPPPPSPIRIDSQFYSAIPSPSPGVTTPTRRFERQPSSPLVTFASKKTVPLLGGYSLDDASTVGTKGISDTCPRVVALPTSYTDLYAELGTLLPDCEQTAVCLVCGEVLNAGGKGECTKHSYRCGGGAGLFFLLQECSGLILHKSKAAYIHSPYVDSHGETPQFRGRPLNLDLVRYEHLRELWMGHAIRQTVVAERGSSRQVILPDFY
jgi:hypothetical protein